ncbi:MAG: thioredoxin domain-containing protein, partial [Nitrospira sp.]|nr:thioredoxin domain-containing protein [Nitrospira sp.]
MWQIHTEGRSIHTSAYFKRSSSQKVNWQPWSEDVFEKAIKEDKPVFLSSGAVWCHWCHVMADECFQNDEIAGILNDNFICIKLDRDERPDIDRRYQTAVALMGSQTGWPLSVFLTPDKKPFYGGTYFPPEERAGRPGFKKILNTILSHYRTSRDEISKYTDQVIQALEPESLESEKINIAHLDKAEAKILSSFDPQNGGFGIAPKFPMPG